MTQVSFYTLDSELATVRLQFACRLSEKAQSMGHRVFIHAESPEQAKLLDNLLWQFKATSFVPHELVAADNTAEDAASTVEAAGSATKVAGSTTKAAGSATKAAGSAIKEMVAIGSEIPASHNDVLINLTDSACSCHQQFSRINEILSSDPESLVRGRECYRFYQAQGYQPETHKL